MCPKRKRHKCPINLVPSPATLFVQMDILHFMTRYLSFPTSQSHFLVLGCFLQSRENHPDAEQPDGAQNRQKKLYLSTRFGQ